mmetsp:Transcript_18434/g.25629  ORF Transcript_18434/g.25629 Transcript_18434/m.25629 type:complete len:92 (-) Transcript_18434:317-592(-)
MRRKRRRGRKTITCKYQFQKRLTDEGQSKMLLMLLAMTNQHDDDIMRNNEGGQTSCNVAPSLTSDYVSLQAKPKREDSTGGMGDVHAATGK